MICVCVSVTGYWQRERVWYLVDSSGRFTAEVKDFEGEYLKVREKVGGREGGGWEG